jgi:hypothetical protein
MRITIKECGVFQKRENELLDFARSYLSEAFPNPDCEGCPPDAALRSLAFNPSESEPTVTEHLAVCSPCFRRYSELLAELKSQRAAEERPPWKRISAWTRARPLLAGAALVSTLFIAIGASLLWNRVRVTNPPPLDAHRAPTPVQPVKPGVAYSPFSLDLSQVSPIRGVKPPTIGSQRRIRVPNSSLDLTLTLPLGSEEQSYLVRLRAGSNTYWSKSTQAHLHNGQILIRVEADFRQVPVGSYNLEVESSNGIRLTQPIVIDAAFPNGADQKR